MSGAGSLIDLDQQIISKTNTDGRLILTVEVENLIEINNKG